VLALSLLSLSTCAVELPEEIALASLQTCFAECDPAYQTEIQRCRSELPPCIDNCKNIWWDCMGYPIPHILNYWTWQACNSDYNECSRGCRRVERRCREGVGIAGEACVDACMARDQEVPVDASPE
jgi:hypothetical protein